MLVSHSWLDKLQAGLLSSGGLVLGLTAQQGSGDGADPRLEHRTGVYLQAHSNNVPVILRKDFSEHLALIDLMTL